MSSYTAKQKLNSTMLSSINEDPAEWEAPQSLREHDGTDEASASTPAAPTNSKSSDSSPPSPNIVEAVDSDSDSSTCVPQTPDEPENQLTQEEVSQMAEETLWQHLRAAGFSDIDEPEEETSTSQVDSNQDMADSAKSYVADTPDPSPTASYVAGSASSQVPQFGTTEPGVSPTPSPIPGLSGTGTGALPTMPTMPTAPHTVPWTAAPILVPPFGGMMPASFQSMQAAQVVTAVQVSAKFCTYCGCAFLCPVNFCSNCGTQCMPSTMPHVPNAAVSSSVNPFLSPCQQSMMQPSVNGQAPPNLPAEEPSMPRDNAGAFMKPPTTVMWRHLPNNYRQEDIVKHLNEEFEKLYDFVYAPFDLEGKSLYGYVFVNFIDHGTAQKFMQRYNGFKNWTNASQKESVITWSEKCQGKDEHILRYKNNSIMHDSVSDEFKPWVFSDGKRVAFPPPTKTLRPPHLKGSKDKRNTNAVKSCTGTLWQ